MFFRSEICEEFVKNMHNKENKIAKCEIEFINNTLFSVFFYELS